VRGACVAPDHEVPAFDASLREEPPADRFVTGRVGGVEFQAAEVEAVSRSHLSLEAGPNVPDDVGSSIRGGRHGDAGEDLRDDRFREGKRVDSQPQAPKVSGWWVTR